MVEKQIYTHLNFDLIRTVLAKFVKFCHLLDINRNRTRGLSPDTSSPFLIFC